MEDFKTILERVSHYIVIIVVTTLGLILILPIFFGVNFGNYGSFIGGVLGTLISCVTVYLVYETYKLQSRELKLSRDELEMTRNQLGIQNFEVTFFNMLNMMAKISTDLRGLKDYANDSFQEATSRMKQLYLGGYNSKNEKINDFIILIAFKMKQNQDGKKYDGIEYKEIENQLKGNQVMVNEIYKNWKLNHPDDEQLIEWIFTYIYKNYYNTRLSQYFRYINGIIDFINNSFSSTSDLDIGRRMKYTNILQTQLSSFELVLLFYNCLTSYSENSDGERELFENVKKYGMIDNVDVQLLMNTNHFEKYR